MKVKVKYWSSGHYGMGYNFTSVDTDKIKTINELDELCKKRFDKKKTENEEYEHIGNTRDTQTREGWDFVSRLLEGGK